MIFLLLLLLSSAVVKEARAETYTYWIEACDNQPGAECEAGDMRLAEWALTAWERAADGALKFEKSPMDKARIRVYWASADKQGLYGEARGILVEGRPGAEVYIRPGLRLLTRKAESDGTKDPLFRDTIVYLTCLHELGHALGLPHTRAFADIMYSFQYGGDIAEYFGRYRRQLRSKNDIPEHPGYSAEDQKRLLAIYKQP